MKTAFAWVEDPRECPRCHGEGYIYQPVEGRGAMHPVEEIRCVACLGTGLATGLDPGRNGP